MLIAVAHTVQKHTTGNYFRQILAQEHQVEYISERTDFISKRCSGVSLEKILPYRVDLLLYIDPVGNSFPFGLENLPCPTAIYLIDVHQNLEHRLILANFFDYVFVAQKDYLPMFRERGINNVFWLPLASDEDVHKVVVKPNEYDIGFVGNRGLVGNERRRLLDNLEKQFKLNDLNRKYSPDEIGIIYSKSQIIFNYSINGDVNMRVFEALCSGRLLLTNAIPNGLEELFLDKQHLVIYHNVEELIELVRYYLSHLDEREAIAQAGQAEVLTKHTYKNRTEQILKTIFGFGEPQLIAPVRTWSAKKRWQFYAKVLEDLRQPLAVLQVARQAWQEGEASWGLGISGIKAALRAINVRIPLTPKALYHRWKVFRSSF